MEYPYGVLVYALCNVQRGLSIDIRIHAFFEMEIFQIIIYLFEVYSKKIRRRNIQSIIIIYSFCCGIEYTRILGVLYCLNICLV